MTVRRRLPVDFSIGGPHHHRNALSVVAHAEQQPAGLLQLLAYDRIYVSRVRHHDDASGAVVVAFAAGAWIGVRLSQASEDGSEIVA